MEVHKQGVNNDHISEYGKGATFQSKSILCSVEKSEVVRSNALANTRENGNSRAVIYTKGILQCTAVENAKELANVKSNARDL